MTSRTIMHFKYKRFNGFCGIANLANTFKEECILDYLDRPEFIPAGYRQMTKILQEIGYAGVFVEPFIQLPTGMVVSNSLIKEIIMDDVMAPHDNDYVPFILNVKIDKTDEYTHSVSVLRFIDKVLYTDPNNNQYIEIETIDKLFDHFAFCVGIWGLERDKEDGSTEVCSLKLRHRFYDDIQTNKETEV